MALFEVYAELDISNITPKGRIDFSGGRKMNPKEFKSFLGMNFPPVYNEVRNMSEDELLISCRSYLKSLKVPTNNARFVENFHKLVEDCELINNIQNEKETVFFNLKVREKLDITMDSVIQHGIFQTKKEVYERAIPGVFEFMPFVEDTVVYDRPFHGGTVTAFNTFIPPFWTKMQPTNASECPDLLKRLLHHLFPDEDSREYVLSWCHHAITSRNDTILCFIGERATGKTLFMEFMEKGFGKRYYELLSKNFFGTFNGNIKEKRLAVLEEVTVEDDEHVNILKRITNDTIPIEAKGKDSVTLPNYMSLVLINNHLKGLRIEPLERRFSVVDIGNVPLAKTYSKEDFELITQLKNTRDDEEPHEIIVNFFHWLTKTYKPKYDNKAPFKKEYFYKVVYEGLHSWKKEIINYIRELGVRGVPFKLSDLRKYSKARQGGESNLKFGQDATREFLRDYVHDGLFKLGEMVELEDKGKVVLAIMPSDEAIEYFSSKRIKIEDIPKTPKDRMKAYKEKIDSQEEVSGEDLL